ncbi:hypothetical protein O181_034615 [Austropuccinia psidii MF-1]|uniref:Uncharacterized protein n=1 Tax=Austropuccinia psidii MF-1 TaxID=1389203 RepID=A0A9Q3D5B7_9BASI|nr:hypothetical protein [Austropuccinia psidii MF-1]
MSPVHLSNLGIPRNQPEDRECLSRARRPGGGNLGHSGNLEQVSRRYFSKRYPQSPYGNHQRLEPHQEFQTPGGEGNQDKAQLSHYTSYRRTAEPDSCYSDSFRLTSSRPNQLSSGVTPFRNQQICGQESPFFTIPGSLQEKTRIQGQKQAIFHPKAERVRPNDPEAVVIGERSKQEPEIAVDTSRISSPINRSINPTQTEKNVVTTESNLNSDKMWFKMSQFKVQTQEKLDDFKRLNERFQSNAILQEATNKANQESCA